MGLFDRLFGNRGDSNQSFRGVCKRCHFSGLLDSEGYCSSCHDLKYRLERLTGGYVQDPQSYVDKLTEDFAFDRRLMEMYSDSGIDDTLLDVEKKFLSYIEGKPADHFKISWEWMEAYFIDVNYLTAKLLSFGYIEITEKRPLQTMLVADLQAILKTYGLNDKGRKQELVTRIEESLTWTQICKCLNGKLYFSLTDKGKALVIRKGVISDDYSIEQKCLALILQDKLKEAYSVVLDYEDKKPVPRGIGELPRETLTYLRINTVLPFELTDSLKPYEKELKASVIYCGMMGSSKASTMFNSLVRKRINHEVLNKTIQALIMMYFGNPIPKGFHIEEPDPNVKVEEISFDRFLATFLELAKKEGINTRKIRWNKMADGTMNFQYGDAQIGRVTFGKRSSRMQVLSSDYVEWMYNKTFDEYVKLLDWWIKYTKELEDHYKDY